MSAIIAKLLFPFYLLLGLISSSIYPSYIQLGAESLTFNYKTGDSRPTYFLSVKNIGPQKVRFDISSDVNWIFITQEGLDNVRTLELDVQNSVNFVLDIRTDLVGDGQHTGKITVDAVYLQDKSILETKEVAATLNKNFVPIPSASPAPSATGTPAETPAATATAIPSAVTQTSPTVSVLKTKTPLPSARVSPSPSGKTEPVKLTSPSISPSPEISRQADFPAGKTKSIWQKIADWFSKVF
ncbi:MAG: hypothetical protein AAB792_01330 [Patescibacteria group bacterium]